MAKNGSSGMCPPGIDGEPPSSPGRSDCRTRGSRSRERGHHWPCRRREDEWDVPGPRRVGVAFAGSDLAWGTRPRIQGPDREVLTCASAANDVRRSSSAPSRSSRSLARRIAGPSWSARSAAPSVRTPYGAFCGCDRRSACLSQSRRRWRRTGRVTAWSGGEGETSILPVSARDYPKRPTAWLLADREAAGHLLIAARTSPDAARRPPA
jgi:hypothetical protein